MHCLDAYSDGKKKEEAKQEKDIARMLLAKASNFFREASLPSVGRKKKKTRLGNNNPGVMSGQVSVGVGQQYTRVRPSIAKHQRAKFRVVFCRGW